MLYTIDVQYVIGVLSSRTWSSSSRRSDVKELLSDEEYAALQEHLAYRPDAGVLITQTGGLRKVRWRAEGSGKRGGMRVIYYDVVAQAQIRMILLYRTSTKDDLTQKEKAVVRRINAEW